MKKSLKKMQRHGKSTPPRATVRLLDGKGGSLVVSVPVDVKGTIPEVPVVVLFEKRAFVQISTQPLTYINVLGGRAKRL